MLRGFLSGIIIGGLLAGLVVALASLVAPLPATVTPQTSTAETTSGTPQTSGQGMETSSQADDAVKSGETSSVSTPISEEQPMADTASAPKPETGGADNTMTAPKAGNTASGIRVEGESPVLPSPQAEAPVVPPSEEDLSITTNPAQPSAPNVPAVSAFPENNAEESVPDANAPATVMPATPTEDTTDISPDAEQDGPVEPVGGAAATTEGGSVMKPAGTLSEKFPQVKSNRLPSVGDDTQTIAPVDRAIDVNRETNFENPDNKPLMAIVLIDDGSQPIARDILDSFPYPLSFAINTFASDVSERATYYRSKGFEVAALVDIPDAALPSDVEVILNAHLDLLPHAVAVMEGTKEGLQGNKPLSDQVATVVGKTGHGLLMFAKGLNTAQKLASREGVPAATVFRDFDSKNQTSSVIRRFLDQAAFKAAQEGGVIMVGRVREETLSALFLWGLQDRASSIALAPMSAVLLADR